MMLKGRVKLLKIQSNVILREIPYYQELYRMREELRNSIKTDTIELIKIENNINDLVHWKNRELTKKYHAK